MRIVFTGGGTGGHFYPLIAVAEEVSVQWTSITHGDKLMLYYFSVDRYDTDALKKNTINYMHVPSGKLRIYPSFRNSISILRFFAGVVIAIVKLFFIYPDVVFGKGGYASAPTLIAARILAIPVVIHESDTIPGRVNMWAGKFARAVAISFPEAASFYLKGNVAITGQPIRKELLTPVTTGSIDYFSLDPLIKVIWVMGGSQGAQRINDLVLDILPTLLESFQVVLITGNNNYDDVQKRANIVLSGNDNVKRYVARPFLSVSEMARLAGISSIVISRAGSFLFEIATWGIPSILIPIPTDISRDQTKNAFTYARAGGCTVVEEKNATPHIVIAEINKLLSNPETADVMRKAASNFSSRDAASVIARKLLDISREHG